MLDALPDPASPIDWTHPPPHKPWELREHRSSVFSALTHAERVALVHQVLIARRDWVLASELARCFPDPTRRRLPRALRSLRALGRVEHRGGSRASAYRALPLLSAVMLGA